MRVNNDLKGTQKIRRIYFIKLLPYETFQNSLVLKSIFGKKFDESFYANNSIMKRTLWWDIVQSDIFLISAKKELKRRD